MSDQKAKLIEYAYPTSDTAKKAGFYNTGCWFVTLYPSVNSCFGKEHTGKYFLEKEGAEQYAESLPYPYNFMHKYHNQ